MSSEAAAWVQAIGSVGAIAASACFFYQQRQHEIELREQDRKNQAGLLATTLHAQLILISHDIVRLHEWWHAHNGQLRYLDLRDMAWLKICQIEDLKENLKRAHVFPTGTARVVAILYAALSRHNEVVDRAKQATPDVQIQLLTQLLEGLPDKLGHVNDGINIVAKVDADLFALVGEWSNPAPDPQ